MEKILEGIKPDQIIKHTKIYNEIGKTRSIYYKNKHFIEYLIIEHSEKHDIIQKKIIEASKLNTCDKINITELLIFYTNECLMDLWYYLEPEYFELYLNKNENYLEVASIALNSKNVKNLLYLMERHNVSFWKSVLWKCISVNEFIKLDKETTKKILLYENFKENLVSLVTDKEYFIKSIKYIKDVDVIKIFIKQLENVTNYPEFKETIFKIALINNHREIIKYFISTDEKISISMIKYVVNPENLDYYNDDFYYDNTLQYYRKYKNTSVHISQNLKILYDKLCEIHGKEDVLNYIINSHSVCLNECILASIIRFHCRFILKDLLIIKGKKFFKNLFGRIILEDLVRYGKNDVLNYIINVIGETDFKNLVDNNCLIGPSLFNPDDRIIKTILKYDTITNARLGINYDFLASSKISDKTKIQKLKILYKKYGKDRMRNNIFYNLKSTDNFKVLFWAIAKFYDNRITNNIQSIDFVVKDIIMSQNMKLFEKFLKVLDEDFNFWLIFNIVISYYDEISTRDKILSSICYRLNNIDKDEETQKNILSSLGIYLGKINYVKGEKNTNKLDKLLKLLKNCGTNLNLDYKNYMNPSSILSTIVNMDNFKTAILNGVSYPKFFRENFDSYSKYRVFDNNRKPWLAMYILVKRLEIRKNLKYKKDHRNNFYDTNICIQYRPPKVDKPVLRKGGEKFYDTQRNMFSDMCWEEDYVNPVHIEPLKLLEIVKNEILVTPKIDGSNHKNIDMTNIYPPLGPHFEGCVFDGEYVEELDMYLIFGIRNKENNLNCPYDDFLEIRQEHNYARNTNRQFNFNSNTLEEVENKINKEFADINEFYKAEAGKTLWWPKAMWKIFDTDITLNILSNLQKIEDNNEWNIKTDGYIINLPYNKKEIYKLKPAKHMTIDLCYDGSWKDKNSNIYQITSEKNLKHGIYRCYYEYGLWVAREQRKDKKYPNNKEIVEAIQNYHNHPWEVKDIMKYNQPAYYQNFYNNPNLRAFSKLRNLWYSKFIHDYMNILDIGCGYLNSSLWNNKYKNIDGIDSDLGIIERFKKVNQDNKRIFVQDFSQKWDMKDDYIKNQVNGSLGEKIYDVILMNFSIHYAFNSKSGFNNLMLEIDKRSVTNNTKLMISFIDCNLLFKDYDKIEFEDEGFLKLKNDLTFNSVNEITYYYPWRSKKVNTEKIFSQEFIENRLERYGWVKKFEYEPDFNINTKGYHELSKSIKRLTFVKKNIL